MASVIGHGGNFSSQLWPLNYPGEESDGPPSAKEELLLIYSHHFTPASFVDGDLLKKNAVPILHISITKAITQVTDFWQSSGTCFKLNAVRVYCGRAPILRMKTIAVGQAYSCLAQPDSPTIEDSLSWLGHREDDSDCEHVSEFTSYPITIQGLIQSLVTNPRHRVFHNGYCEL